MYLQTTALFIYKRPLREADRFYGLLSPKIGKVEAKIKGVAKSGSKLAGQVEPVALVETMLVKGINWTVAGAIALERFNPWLSVSIDQAGFIQELVIKTLPLEQPEPRLFNLLLNYLRYLASQTNLPVCQDFDSLPAVDSYGINGQLVRLRFLWQWLGFLGFGQARLKKIDFRQLTPLAGELLKACQASQAVNLPIKSNSDILREAERYTKQVMQNIFEKDFISLSLE